ncbi:unnamed protein product [Arabidopsis thaliana]|uniref:F-box domain-containing protein n=1 Tax=Arabidopsis thaliana TaxID=3702 RepID=A0A5S9X205_ARATH|nr:unnamed protein product [Arabidopsis thaliana]
MVRLDLPWDLEDEILSRLPATSLGRLRFRCKRWNALFKDPEFITKQFHKAAKQDLVLMLSNFGVYSMSTNLKELPNNIEIAQVFHCNGLLLCSTKEGNKTKLVVVNPCTGQTRWIEPRSDYNYNHDIALGYENNSTKKSYDSYKILRITYGCKLVEIFELKSNSWRVLSKVHPNVEKHYYGGVSFKGNTYWLSYTKFNILSFDFTTETFRSVPLPFLYQDGFVTLALSVVREEQLLLLHSRFDMGQVGIWMCNKIDTETVLSWSKSFTLEFDSLRDLPVMSILRIFIEEDKKVIVVDCDDRWKENMIYIVGKNGFKKLSYEKDRSNLWRLPFFFSYVPSLVGLYPPM